MYAIAVNGSPRKGGNTEFMLNVVLGELALAGWKTDMVQIGGKPLHGCIACYKCMEKKNRQCAIKTDQLNDVLARMYEADAIVLGSPTYFADVTAEMKALIDRGGMTSRANDRALKGKIGAAVVAMRRGGATNVFDTMNHLLLYSGMIVPGSTYWNIGIGREKGEVEKDEEGLTNMRNLGQMIAWLGKALKPHMADFPA